MDMRHLYPVTIIQARYSGVYEGGAWVALHCHADEVPQEIEGDDLACSWWFHDNPGLSGAGATPDEALANLLKIKAQA